MGMFDRSVRVGGGQVMLAIARIAPGGEDVDEHVVVLQYPDGAAAVARVEELAEADLPTQVYRRFDAGRRDDNRGAAVVHALRLTGYGDLDLA